MLAQLIVEPLIASLVFLVLGWIWDTMHASMHHIRGIETLAPAAVVSVTPRRQFDPQCLEMLAASRFKKAG
jgi:hypothetical protein